MASASQITIMRELSAAGDRERTGALDVEWDGARASLFFIFGHANHVELERADGRKLVGTEALSAIVEEIPEDFRISPWRRAMVTDDTLRCTAEELMFMFRRDPAKASGRLAEHSNTPDGDEAGGADAADLVASLPEPEGDEQPAGATEPTPATDETSGVPFGVADFPVLPQGAAMFSDSAANVEGLDGAVPHLPDSLILLTGPENRGAVLVGGGRVADAVYVDGERSLTGDDAAAAVFGAREGVLSAYRVGDPRLIDALPALWRSPRLCAAVPGSWVDPEAFLDDAAAAGATLALVVSGSDEPGVALIQDGALVAVASAARPAIATDQAALRALLHAPEARVTLIGASEAGGSDPVIGGTTFPLILDPRTTAPEPEAAVAEEFAAEIAAVDPGLAAHRSHEPAVFSLDELGEPSIAEPQGDAVAELEAAIELDEAVAEIEAAAEAQPAAEIDEALEAAEAAAAAQTLAEMEAVAEIEALAELEEAAALEQTIAELEAAAEVEAVAEALAQLEAAAEVEEAVAEIEEAVAELEAASPPEERDAEPPAPPVFSSVVDGPDEFVPARVDVDIDGLRAELVGIAEVWLGEADAAPVAAAIHAARPGVDDFVAAIQAIASMEIPGHEHAVVRAMAREMHFRAAEVLCGV